MAAFIVPCFLHLAVCVSSGQDLPASDRSRGVTLRIYCVEQAPVRMPTLVEGQTPNLDRLIPEFDVRGAGAFGSIPAPIVTTLSARLRVPGPGPYVFRLTSDDGSWLEVNGERVIDNDGRHGMVAVASEPIELEGTEHDILIGHFDSGGDRGVLLEWRPPGVDVFGPIPGELLTTERDPTRVTSPGVKRVTGGGRPGDGLPLVDVHPAWRVDSIRPDGFEPMVGAMCFDRRGRLIVGTFFPLQRDEVSLPDIESKSPDTLIALSGVTLGENPTGDPARVTIETVADGIFEPAGLCAVGDVLYVSQRRAITRLTDRDGDGYYEHHEDVGTGWEGWNYHQFTFDLEHIDPDGAGAHPGFLYAALSTAMAPPGWEGMHTNSGPNGPMRGGVLEVDLSSNDARVIAGGTRTPNGLGVGPEVGGAPTLFYADNQGTWMPTSQFSEVVPGRFYGHYNWTDRVARLTSRFPDGGHPSALSERPRTPPALFLPQNEVSNSPTESLLIETGPFAGQMLLGELTAGGLRRVFLERVNGQFQGALFRHSQGLEVGVNRLVRGPDGALFIGGIGGGGNWNWRDTRYGLQRLTPTGADVFEFREIRATADGFLVSFTRPVIASWLASPDRYSVSQWSYTPTVEYGGPKENVESLTVLSAQPVDVRDGNALAVRLEVPGLKAGRCVHLRCDARAAGSGELIRSPEAWYTLNHVPGVDVERPRDHRVARDIDRTGIGVGILPPADAIPLISRSSRVVWRHVEGGATRPNLRTQDDLMEAPSYIEVGGGDMQTAGLMGDCRLHIEWLAPPGGSGQLAGNSGVYLQNLYEIQVLGTETNDALRGRPLESNEAGAIYGIAPASRNASTGSGTWQAYDIWFEAARYEGDVKTRAAQVTVYWNGQLIHDEVSLQHATGSRRARELEAVRAKVVGADELMQLGPLLLQDHATQAEGPVRYRNVWIRSLEPRRYVPGRWLDVCDGRSLNGWTQVGGDARYGVKESADGVVIKGTSVPNSPNSFLVLKESLDDFELLVEVQQHPDLNSGIQIRSHVDGGLSNRRGVLRGLQVEMDPSERAFTGGLYDEGGRGWVYPLGDAPYARRAYRAGEWNRIRIVAEGGRVRTWVNGIPTTDFYDASTRSGNIALQVHDVGGRTDPLSVQWRNLRIRPLESRVP